MGVKGEKALLKRLLAEIKPGDVVYDIGANIGTHSGRWRWLKGTPQKHQGDE